MYRYIYRCLYFFPTKQFISKSLICSFATPRIMMRGGILIPLPLIRMMCEPRLALTFPGHWPSSLDYFLNTQQGSVVLLNSDKIPSPEPSSSSTPVNSKLNSPFCKYSEQTSLAAFLQGHRSSLCLRSLNRHVGIIALAFSATFSEIQHCVVCVCRWSSDLFTIKDQQCKLSSNYSWNSTTH